MPSTRRLLIPGTLAATSAVHHHAYLWAGKQWPTEEARRDPGQPTPPWSVNAWLSKPSSMEHGCFESVEQCVTWLELQFSAYPPAAFNYEREAWVQAALVNVAVGRSFTRTYGAVAADSVALALIACPRPGIPCPTPDREPVRHE